jgi:hypothetical protein
VPTSVLLAVLAAAGLLALAPALTRHPAGRVAARPASSTARVLSRRRRRRTVPGRRPVNPPSWVLRRVSSGRPRVASSRSRARGSRAPVRRVRRPPIRRRRSPTALHRRRRVLIALLALCLIEVVGAVVVGPGFWIGFAACVAFLLADLIYLRHRAVVTARRRAARRRRLAWVAAEQAAVRRQQDRRATERRALARAAVAERHRARPGYVEHYARRATP